jgi:hypothetical protein
VVADDHEIINHGADYGHWDCCPGPEDIAAGIAMAVKFAAEEEGRVVRVFVWFESFLHSTTGQKTWGVGIKRFFV